MVQELSLAHIRIFGSTAFVPVPKNERANFDPTGRKCVLVGPGRWRPVGGESYTQRAGIDYEETYSPVVRYDSLRAVFAIAAALDLEIGQLDIKTAFLYGDLNEELYMSQPTGFVS